MCSVIACCCYWGKAFDSHESKGYVELFSLPTGTMMNRIPCFELDDELSDEGSSLETSNSVHILLGKQPKRPNCNKSVDILQQLVTTSRHQDAFAWLATACGTLSTGLML